MPTWLPWVIMVLGLGLGVGLMIYNVVREEDDEDSEEDANAETIAAADPLARTADERSLDKTADERAQLSAIVGLRTSLEQSSPDGTGVRSSTDRMTLPWYLLVGPEGSGKTTLLDNTGLGLPFGPAFEVDSIRKDAGRWWLFEQAVVLEAPPAGLSAADAALTLGKTMPPDTSAGWNTMLQMLRRERPDAPLNGIIITVSCSDLLDGRRRPELLREQADRIRTYLDRARQTLGVRLPIHVVVTKCDALPGFRSFANNLPQARRHDIFGWANSAAPDRPFDPEWIETGFAQLRTSLEQLRDEVLAAPQELRESDGLFVFVHEFPDLKEPLREFVTRLVPATKGRPPLLFRGMYFCGEAVDPAAIPGIDDTSRLAFVRSLFRDKIFPEGGMARPTSRLRFARDRRVVLAQAAAIVFALVGGAGLWTAVNGFSRGNVALVGLRQNAESLTRVLSGLVVDLDEMKRGPAAVDSMSVRRTRDAAAIELVGEMRRVETLRRSAFLPVSWFSGLPTDVRTSMVVGVQEIVLPVIRQRLQERADRLLSATSPEASISDDLTSVDARELTNYLSNVRTLSRNIARYNLLASTDSARVSDLAALLEYLFGETILSDSGWISPDFQSALRMARSTPIVISADRSAAVLNRAVSTVSTVAGAAARQLMPRTSAVSERGVNPNMDLAALRGLAALVELTHPTRGLKATLSDSTILGLPLTRMVEDSIAARIRLAAVRITRDTLPPDQQGARLHTIIENLFALRFMERSEGREVVGEIQPNQRLRWDVGRLELALTLRGEFDQAVLTLAEAFPGQSPDRMRRALEIQLRARAIDVAGSAQRFTPLRDVSDVMAEARASGANLDASSSRITRLAELLDSLRAAGEGRKLLMAGTRQAEQILGVAQGVLERQKYFAPQTARIAAWQGVIPVSYAALGVTDSISFETLALQHLTGVRALAHDVAAALRFLRLPALDSATTPQLVNEWEAIATSVSKYERGDPTSSLGALYRYLREDMHIRELETCRAMPRRDSVPASSDAFVTRRRQFKTALSARCGNAGMDAVRRYQALSALFTRQLAGRYPFVDSATAARARAPQADPASVREFFRAYDAFLVTADVALRSDPRLAAPAKAALTFVDQLAEARAFFAPMLDPRDRSLPRYSLLASPVDTVADVELHVDGRMLPLDEGDRAERWQFGDSVSVLLDDVDGIENVFSATAGWSLLQLLQRAPQHVRVRVFHPETQTEVALPAAFPTAAPEITLPRTAPAASRKAATQ